MRKTNLRRDEIIGSFPGDTHDENRIFEKSSSPPGGPTAEPPSAATWTARLKRRWKSMLAWLARGAKHSCPT